jgi:nitroreductase
MVMPLIRKRRSIRKFLENVVEDEKIGMLIEAALRSPSSRDLQPWEFIVVTDPDSLGELSRAKYDGSAFLRNAPLGIVVCANPDRSDTWIEDASIASICIQLAAESLGLGSCWIQIRDRMHDTTKTSEEYISELLGIPKKLRIEAIIGIGYPGEKKPPRSKDGLAYERVYINKYGNSYGSPGDEQ